MLLGKPVQRLGIGTIWFGRQWPPGNAQWTDPSEAEIDAHLHAAFQSVPSNVSLMLDTAEGYDKSEARLGAWLAKPENAGALQSAIICTKFGETFDASTGSTVVDLSPTAAQRCLDSSRSTLGRVDLFYSHVTSQLSPQQAEDALANPELVTLLSKMKETGSIALIGCSLSHEKVLEEALANMPAWFQILDVLQLPSSTFLKHPEMIEALASLGKVVIVNSPGRKIDRELHATHKEAIEALLANQAASVILTGTRTHLAETLGILGTECNHNNGCNE